MFRCRLLYFTKDLGHKKGCTARPLCKLYYVICRRLTHLLLLLKFVCLRAYVLTRRTYLESGNLTVLQLIVKSDKIRVGTYMYSVVHNYLIRINGAIKIDNEYRRLNMAWYKLGQVVNSLHIKSRKCFHKSIKTYTR